MLVSFNHTLTIYILKKLFPTDLTGFNVYVILGRANIRIILYELST